MKHVEFHSKNKFEKIVHLAGFIVRSFIFILNFYIHASIPGLKILFISYILQWFYTFIMYF